MRPIYAILLLSLAATTTQADTDPLKSPACGAAIQSLEQARSQPQHKAKVEALRKQAAQACLGDNDATRPSARAPYPPVAVAPITTATPRPLPAPPRPAPPPTAIQRPPAITSCDPAGCWDSNGNRLSRAGPTLLGPQGVCTQVAGVLSCP